MRQQLEQYVDLLFAAHPEAGEIRQQILRDTLDRYDDLIARGNTPAAAYSLAIAAMGDVSGMLNPDQSAEVKPESAGAGKRRKILRSIGGALYLLCPVPVVMLEHTRYVEPVGVPLMLLMAAAATGLLMLSRKNSRGD